VKKLINYRLIFVFICFFLSRISAQGIAPDFPKAKEDTSAIVQHNSGVFSIDSYKKDEAYNYNRNVVDINYWDRTWQWIKNKLGINQVAWTKPLESKYLWYVLFAGLLIAVVIKLYKAEIKSFFYTGGEKVIRIKELDENIHEINFETLIRKAIAEGNYKYAVRLYYLKSLKELNEKKLIAWEIDKTNRDYYYELSGSPMQQPFAGITGLFNWIWYGDKRLGQQEFLSAKEQFTSFEDHLSKTRR
jgi:hypothetical protein